MEIKEGSVRKGGGNTTPKKSHPAPIPPKQQKVDKPTIATAQDWEQTQGSEFTIDLPSGITVKARTLDLLDLVTIGHIPLPLLNSTLKVGENFQPKKGSGKSISSNNPFEGLAKDDLTNLRKLMELAAVHAVVQPKVSLNGENKSINVKKIKSIDLYVIFDRCVSMEGAAQFGQFLQ